VQDRVISLLPDDPHHILISAAKAEDWAHANALVVDVRDGSPSLLLRSTDNAVKWIADAEGVVRLKTTLDHREDGTLLVFWARDDDHADWRVVHRYELDVGERFIPLSFSPRSPDDLLVLADQSNGRLALQTLNSRTAAMGPVLAADPECDIEPVERDSQVVGYRDPCRDQEETYLDEGWQKDQAVLRRALKTPLIEIVDRTADGSYALVKSMASPTAAPVFWYFDQSPDHPKTLVHIGDSNQGLKPDMAASAQEVSIAARDGLILPAILTLPPGHGDGPLPFVVLPHGGPTAHDSLQYDWIVQFIASRGYGVLQPQFRGSTGYGAAFQRAGYRQWGARMQDDVTDATNWLIAQKLADPDHICIVGSSYGGYAALIGAARHPELYRGAAALAPVTDMGRLMRDRDHSEFGDINHRRVMGTMDSAGVPSPVDLAPEIAVPVLLVHGRRDFTVPVAHTEAMETALRRAGRSPTVVYLKDTDHFFSNEEGRLQTLKALDGFLSAALSTARTPRS
jgi:dipeptidyl aminopeptidase/acylaminoacyl peptidase